MKRSLFLTIALVMFATPSFATVERFKSGVTELVKSPLQIIDHAKAESKDAKILPLALAGGIFKGIFYMGHDMVHGVYDIVTSPVR